jgi:diguanylate cyclase (GGDEF)-like protein
MKLVETMRYEELKASGNLPSPNGLVLAITKLLQRDDYKIDDVVHLVQSDPALAGQLLKFSNAASFGHSRPIVSLSKAVISLGTHRVRVLILALCMLHNNRIGKCQQFDYGRFWSRALAAAISAQTLASYAKISAEDNFTAGLLCSIGELSLASIFPERYGEIIVMSGDDIHKRIALEQEAFNTDHRELAATLILEWGLPEVLATAIYHCELPDEADFLDGSRIHELTLCLHVSLSLAEVCMADEGARWAKLPNFYAKAARLGINTQELNLKADGIVLNWLEWGELLKIQTREINSFSNLLASTQFRELDSTLPICPWPNNKSALLICPELELSSLAVHLEVNGYTVMHESNSADGLAVALEESPDLVMVKIADPEVDGAAFCQAMHEDPRGRTCYIVLIVEHEDDNLFVKVLNIQADDFLLMPITRSSLQAKLHGIFNILQLQKDLVRERSSWVTSAGDWAGANRRLIQEAMTDPLTHVSNRRYGLDFLASEWEFSKVNNLPLSCLMIDIDHFKQVNDQYGHQSGDAVLIKLAGLLQSGARSVDLVFRYGGEEFCIVCPGATLEMALVVAERVRQNIESQLFKLEHNEIYITVSIGVAIVVQEHADKDALLHDADEALYRAKEGGRNRVESGTTSPPFYT